MRKVNKRRMLLATLLVLAMLLCSFPVISAEAMNAGISAEEITAETIPAPEETAGSEEEPALEAAPEAESETESEAEPAVEPETELEVEPAVEPETEPEVEPVVEPEIEPEVEPTSEPEDAAETESAEAPEAAEDPADEPEEEIKPEREEEPVQESAEEALEEELEEAPEDNLCEIDDDDAGYISDELLEMYNNLAEEQKAEFTGKVDIELKDSKIAFGQDVTLIAKVFGAETLNYRLIWEANDGDERGWYTVGAGTEYTFLLTRANAEREYRVVLFAVG